MTFIQEAWYVLALTSEIGEQPLARTVAGQPLVVYRTSGGPVALADRCPHRRYPLSRGRLAGDVLVCGYHGFSFDCDGKCVAVPGQDRIPSKATVRRFPLRGFGPWTLVWMGEGLAEESLLPDLHWLSDKGWAVIAGVAPLEARMELLVDNLLDLSHETFLHSGSIGTPEVAETAIDVAVDEVGHVVRVDRHMEAVECPSFYASSTGLSGHVDRWQDIEYFAPGLYVLHSRIAPTGDPPRTDGSDPNGFHMKVLYGLTPSTTGRTYDFWAVARDFAIDDDKVSRFLDKMQSEVVAQDVEALEVLEQRTLSDSDPFEVNVKIDRGGLAARRLLHAMAAAAS